MVRSSIPISRRITATVCLNPYSVRPEPTLPSRSSLILIGRQDARNPLRVHGLSSELAQRVIASCFGASARIAVSGEGHSQKTGSPVFDRLVAISPSL
jgi:hypothetical protein